MFQSRRMYQVLAKADVIANARIARECLWDCYGKGATVGSDTAPSYHEIGRRHRHAVLQFVTKHGYSVLFGGIFAQHLGLPLPGPLFLLAAGALAATGKMWLAAALILAVAACVLGDWAGTRRVGARATGACISYTVLRETLVLSLRSVATASVSLLGVSPSCGGYKAKTQVLKTVFQQIAAQSLESASDGLQATSGLPQLQGIDRFRYADLSGVSPKNPFPDGLA